MLWYGVEHWAWKGGALDVVIKRQNLIGGPWVGGQTLGWIIFYKNYLNFQHPGLRTHERVHVRHAKKGGIFFAIAYGICFFWYWMFGLRNDWQTAYRLNWFEDVAYREGDQIG